MFKLRTSGAGAALAKNSSLQSLPKVAVEGAALEGGDFAQGFAMAAPWGWAAICPVAHGAQTVEQYG